MVCPLCTNPATKPDYQCKFCRRCVACSHAFKEFPNGWFMKCLMRWRKAVAQ